jgi:predicted AAA+ superfamily ATPase
MFPRGLEPVVRQALGDTPVVVVDGARQTGKSTLVRSLVPPSAYLSLDDPVVLAAASRDATGFVAGLPSRVVIDEVQRAAALVRPIKLAVDRERAPGRFVLTGSTDLLRVPDLADALVGRSEIHTLGPLSESEIRGAPSRFVDACFAAEAGAPPTSITRNELVALVTRGGFPEAVARPPARRAEWFRSYIRTVLERTVPDVAAPDRRAELPDLLRLLAARTASVLNNSELSRALGIPQTTLKRYVALLESVFLIRRLRAWAGNRSKRIVRAPKVHLVDPGLAAGLLGLGETALRSDPIALGALTESFVVGELATQASWSRSRPSLFHFRTHGGAEVDLVLERPDGLLLGIEVKAGATVETRDLRGLRALADAAGDRFARGIVLYTGTSVVPFGDRVAAVPLSVLWSGADASREEGRQ